MTTIVPEMSVLSIRPSFKLQKANLQCHPPHTILQNMDQETGEHVKHIESLNDIWKMSFAFLIGQTKSLVVPHESRAYLGIDKPQSTSHHTTTSRIPHLAICSATQE